MAKVIMRGISSAGAEGAATVENFSLEVHNGEFLVLLGPRDCGNSTVLRMLAGLEDITSGEIYIDEEAVGACPAKDRQVAVVFQNGALYPHMTAFDNMAFGLTVHELPAEEVRWRVQNAAAVLDIAHLLDRKPKALSAGQRHRVMLGRAIVRHPKVYVLDHPLSSLDDKLRAQMRTELSKIHARLGATFLYATQDQTEALAMGDRVAVMKEGKIVQMDRPSALYSGPNSLFTAKMVGCPPINLIEAQLVAVDGSWEVVFGRDGYRCVIPLPQELGRRAADYRGTPLLLGLRPDSFREEPEFHGAPGYQLVRVTAGGESAPKGYVNAVLAGFSITVRAPQWRPYRQPAIDLALRLGELHLFSPETEQAIF